MVTNKYIMTMMSAELSSLITGRLY